MRHLFDTVIISGVFGIAEPGHDAGRPADGSTSGGCARHQDEAYDLHRECGAMSSKSMSLC